MCIRDRRIDVDGDQRIAQCGDTEQQRKRHPVTEQPGGDERADDHEQCIEDVVGGDDARDVSKRQVLGRANEHALFRRIQRRSPVHAVCGVVVLGYGVCILLGTGNGFTDENSKPWFVPNVPNNRRTALPGSRQ